MRKRIIASLVLILVILAFGGLIVPLQAQEVTKGYKTTTVLERGTIVNLASDSSDTVAPTTANTLHSMHGVVVNANDAPLTIAGEGQQTFVTTSGEYEVLVSNESGAIAVGDHISVGSLDGIGIKAGKSQSTIIGKALAGFDGTSNVIGNLPLNDSGSGTVAIGRILAAIHVTSNPQASSDVNIPNFLKRTAESVADKQVSTPRLYTGFVVLITTMGVVISMLYAGIRSGIISIGRNPLSQKTITRGLIQVLVGSMFIFIAGLFAVYLLLKL